MTLGIRFQSLPRGAVVQTLSRSQLKFAGRRFPRVIMRSSSLERQQRQALGPRLVEHARDLGPEPIGYMPLNVPLLVNTTALHQSPCPPHSAGRLPQRFVSVDHERRRPKNRQDVACDIVPDSEKPPVTPLQS
jgi:hypothetical protein